MRNLLMEKIFFIVFISSFLFACNDNSGSGSTDNEADEVNIKIAQDNFNIKTNSKSKLNVLSNDENLPVIYQMSVDERSNQGAKLTIEQNNIVYTSANSFTGADFFEYHVTIGDDVLSARVDVLVEPVNIVKIEQSSDIAIEGETITLKFEFDSIILQEPEIEVSNIAPASIDLEKLSSTFHGNHVIYEFKVFDEEDFLRGESLKFNFLLPTWLEGNSLINFNYYSKPDMAKLNWPQRSIFTRESLKELLIAKNEIDFYWLNFGSWEVPEDPTWHENPVDNVSWQLFYHSLGWLTTYGEVYKDTDEQVWLDKISTYLVDYNSTYPYIENASPSVAYREDAVALRVNHLLYFYLNFFEAFNKDTQVALLNLLDKDWKMLQFYINDPIYDDENHGLIQAKSALNLFSVFAYKSKAEELFNTTISRLRNASKLMFDGQSGQSVEQAFEYHFTGISMLLEAKIQLDNLQISSPNILVKTLSKAISKGPYLLNEDGTSPAIGDSYNNKYWLGYLKGYYAHFKVRIPEFEAFLERGQIALDALNVSEVEGLVIAKSDSPKGASKVYFDAGPIRIVHGHFDNLNIVYNLHGENVLVDSGGPFSYNNPGRQNFWSLSNHNTLVLDELESNLQSAQLNQAEQQGNLLLFAGNQPISNTQKHSRAIAFSTNENPTLVVIDNAVGAKKYEENWHYAHSSNIYMESDTETKIALKSGKTVFQKRWSTSSPTCKIEKGVFDETGTPLQGWITEGYNTGVEAPVKECITLSNSYYTVNVFSLDKELKIELKDVSENTVKITAGEIKIIYDKVNNILSITQ